MGLRRTYSCILGIILIAYGVVLNLLGAMASFLHPGSYHHGAMGTPMWSGLAFIIFGAINVVKSLEDKKEEHGFSILLPIVNVLVVLVSGVCISLTSWAMSAPGLTLLTGNKVSEITLTLVAPSNNSQTTENAGELQMSLLPLYSTVVVASGVILVMAMLGACIECVIIAAFTPSTSKERQANDAPHWDERDGLGPQYLPPPAAAAVDEGKPQAYLAGDAVGEVMYGNTPQFVNTVDRQSFRHNVDPALPVYNGNIPRLQGQPQQQLEQQQQQQTAYQQRHQVVQRGDKPRDRSYLYRVPEERQEVDRPVRRPNPYFYL
ncbi:uncharacterized protein [Diadema antillarum]|uniref:uncharacterized protein n=1 Tax=Diadema antillarum TaxID=105358 RepID=UPI003A83DD33